MSGRTPRPSAARVRDLERTVTTLECHVKDLQDDLKEARAAQGFFPAEGYEPLFRILKEAHDQAAFGKGADRHGNGLPFAAQPMQTIGFLLHSSEGMLYQVLKKTQEANSKLEDARRSGDPEEVKAAKKFARRELLGAINYLAGALIYEDAHL